MVHFFGRQGFLWSQLYHNQNRANIDTARRDLPNDDITICYFSVFMRLVNAFKMLDGWRSYHLANLVWNIAFITLPLDLLMLIVEPEQIQSTLGSLITQLDPLIVLLAALAYLGTASQVTLGWSEKFQKFQDVLSNSSFHTYALGLAILIPLAELAIRLSQLGLGGIAFIITFLVIASFSIRSQLKQARSPSHKDSRGRNWQTELNRQNLIVQLIPIIAARLLSLIGVTQSIGADSSLGLVLLFPICASAVLLALMPKAESYFITCRGCANRFERILTSGGYCRECQGKIKLSSSPKSAQVPLARLPKLFKNLSARPLKLPSLFALGPTAVRSNDATESPNFSKLASVTPLNE